MTLYSVCRAILVGVSRVLFRVQVQGAHHVPTSGAYILAPTHRSALDIPFAAAVTRRRIRFLAKDELFRSRFGGWLFPALGAIRVERGTVDRAALRALQGALEAGEPVAVFPEGTRRSGPAVVDIFDGAAYLAAKVGVPIVPIGIGGSEAILAKGRRLPRLERVAIVVGAPIEPATTEARSKRAESARISAALRAELQAALDQAAHLVDH